METTLPFSLKHYGSFKKMMHMKKVDGVVDLKTALNGKQIYGVGAIKNAEGEITVHDGKAWLSYGKDGMDKVTHEIPEGEQAMLLVTAQVEKWQDLFIPKDMAESELHVFMLEQAKKSGIDTEKPFPFLIEGQLKNLTWHVIDGTTTGTGGGHNQAHGEHSFIRKLIEHNEKTSSIIIGFYSADIHGVFTHPGESWHVHVIFKDEKKAGHVENYGVLKNSTLKLPVR
ncbi:MAG: acetolactate decarboxylase [Nitrospirota bacterium]